MDIQDIRKRRALINSQISKGFNANFSEDNISKAYADEFEKGHKVGDVSSNGKYVWTEYKPGKFDWRTRKGGSSKPTPSAAPKSSPKVNKYAPNGNKNSVIVSSTGRHTYRSILLDDVNAVKKELDGWKNAIPVKKGKGKFPWIPSNKVYAPKGYEMISEDACKRIIKQMTEDFQGAYDNAVALQKEKSSSSLSKSLTKAGYSLFVKNTNGSLLYLLDDAHADKIGGDNIPAVILKPNGGFKVAVYEKTTSNMASNRYGKLLNTFDFGPRVVKSTKADVLPEFANNIAKTYYNFVYSKNPASGYKVEADEGDDTFYIKYTDPDNTQNVTMRLLVVPCSNKALDKPYRVSGYAGNRYVDLKCANQVELQKSIHKMQYLDLQYNKAHKALEEAKKVYDQATKDVSSLDDQIKDLNS